MAVPPYYMFSDTLSPKVLNYIVMPTLTYHPFCREQRNRTVRYLFIFVTNLFKTQ